MCDVYHTERFLLVFSNWDAVHSAVLSPFHFRVKENLCAFLTLPLYEHKETTGRKIGIIMVMTRKFV